MLPCIIGQINQAVCDGLKENGCCKIYLDEGVAIRNYHWGSCPFDIIRRPITEVEKGRTRVGQQKQSKKKVKSGNVE